VGHEPAATAVIPVPHQVVGARRRLRRHAVVELPGRGPGESADDTDGKADDADGSEIDRSSCVICLLAYAITLQGECRTNQLTRNLHVNVASQMQASQHQPPTVPIWSSEA
jgi:hypothetical protein